MKKANKQHRHTDLQVHDPDILDPADGHPAGKWGVSCEKCSVFAYADTEKDAWKIIKNITPAKPWNSNRVQFARLLAEIKMAGLSAKQMNYLSKSMDLSKPEINSILDRAEEEFEEIKSKL